MTYAMLCYVYSGLNPEIIERMPNDLVEAFIEIANELGKPKEGSIGNIPPNILKKFR